MRVISENKIKSYLISFMFLLIVFAFYLSIFVSSMYTAFDREQYLRMMEFPFEGREEPLIHVISYFLGFFISSANYKLIITQVFFTQLLILTLLKKGKMYNVKNLAKMLFFCFILFSVFSNSLGVQLRIGYATIIFLFIVFYKDVKPKIRNIPIFLIPCFMHFAIIPSIILFYLFSFLKIKNAKRFFVFVFFSIVFLTLVIKFLPFLFDLLGIDSYYYAYLAEDGEFGRAFPFSIVFYLVFYLLSLFFCSKDLYEDNNYWFGMSGIILIYLGLVLDFYLAFKILVPISAFLYIYMIDKSKLRNINSQMLLVVTIAVIPLGLFALIKQVGLI